MNFVPLVISLMIGSALGVVMTGVCFHGKLQMERERVKAQIDLGLASATSEVSNMNVRARAQEDVINKQDELIRELKSQKDRLDVELRSVMSARVAAEQENTRIPQLSSELADSKREVSLIRDELTSLKEEKAKVDETLGQERSKAAEKIEAIDRAEQKLSDAFKAIASEALSSNNKTFLDLAKSQFEVIHEQSTGELEKRRQSIDDTMKPVKESLEKVDLKINELEKARAGAYSALRGQLESLVTTQAQLQKETAKLVGALGTPVVRGRWGEIQLKRVVEMAGMVDHCDFFEQENRNTEEGRVRPDLIVKLPGNKNIVIDAKAPLKAYLEALDETEDGPFRAKMKDHSAQIRNHVTSLSRKSYAEQFDSKPEFVVLFLPGEVFYSAALQHDPGLIEVGVEQGVIIATPTTLIALLRAVAYGWRQEALEQNAKQIGSLGRELYDRISIFSSHLCKLGKNLDTAVKSYNATIGSVERRVLVTARRFKDLGASSNQEIESFTPIEVFTTTLAAPELTNHHAGLDSLERT